MQLCEYDMFAIGLPLYVPKNGVFEGFEGEDVKRLCSNPSEVTTLREYASVAVSRFNGLSSRSVERFCVQRKK